MDKMLCYKGEKITIGTSAIGFSDDCLVDKRGNPAKKVEFTVEDSDIRYTLDGTDPTMNNGILVREGDSVTIEGENNIQQFRAIRCVGRDAIIQPIFYREL